MAKFILLYKGPATPMDQFTPEVSEQLMAAWNSWMGKVGEALVDGGAPFAGSTALAGDGSITSASDLNGYTILEAPDLEAARNLCQGHPFLESGTADFAVEIYELGAM
jgi:YCII-related domain